MHVTLARILPHARFSTASLALHQQQLVFLFAIRQKSARRKIKKSFWSKTQPAYRTHAPHARVRIFPGGVAKKCTHAPPQAELASQINSHSVSHCALLVVANSRAAIVEMPKFVEVCDNHVARTVARLPL